MSYELVFRWPKGKAISASVNPADIFNQNSNKNPAKFRIFPKVHLSKTDIYRIYNFRLPNDLYSCTAKNGSNRFIHKSMKYIVSTVAVWLLLLTAANAQDTWSLERCIRYAQENNITVQQADANVKISLLAEKQAKAARLPNVSANADLGKQFGRTIDPTSNQFSNTSNSYNSLGLSAGISLFNGGLIHHQVKQAGWDVQASNADAAQTVNNLGLQVAQAYLNILLSNEQLENAKRRVAQSEQQLNVTLKLIEAGNTPMAENTTSLRKWPAMNKAR